MIRALTLGGRLPASLFVAAALFAVCALVVPRFATAGNLDNLTRVAAILAIAACGQALVLVVGAIEFSFGSSVALASVAAVLVLPEAGPVAAFLAAFATVLAVSGLNGVLVGYVALPPVVVTLGTLMIAHGIAATLAGGLPIDATPSAVFSFPATGRIAGISVAVWVAGLSLLVLALLLSRTVLGRRLILVGANEEAARLSGIPIARAKLLAYVLAGAFCGLAAIVLTSRVGSGQPNLMPNLPFLTIAACAVGGIPLSGGRGTASEVLAGVAIVAMLNNATILLNYPSAVQLLLTAAVIVGAVAVQAEALRGVLARSLRRARP